jgi:hypothetical protein
LKIFGKEGEVEFSAANVESVIKAKGKGKQREI